MSRVSLAIRETLSKMNRSWMPRVAESARGELVRNVVARESSCFFFWTGEQLDMPTLGLLSRTAFPLKSCSSVRLLCLGVHNQHRHLLAHSMLMVFRGSLTNLSVISLGERLSSLRIDVFVGDMGVHARGDCSRARNSHVADEDIVSWRATGSCEAQGLRSGLAENVLLHTIVGDPDFCPEAG